MLSSLNNSGQLSNFNINDWEKQLANNAPREAPKDKVLARVLTVKGNKYYLRIHIGLVICELLGLKLGDRLNLLINKKDPSLILLQKSEKMLSGYRLSKSSSISSSSLCLNFSYVTGSRLTLKSTETLDFELNETKMLLISLVKLKG